MKRIWFLLLYSILLHALAVPVGAEVLVPRSWKFDRDDGRPAPQTVRRLPNGVVTTWTSDGDMRLVGLRHEGAGRLLAGWRYRYDSWGRIESLHDELTQELRTFHYDPLGRLERVAGA